MRFRIGKYGISTDIEEAFLQVGLYEKDRDTTCYFWLANEPHGKLTTYRLMSVLFEAMCSPFILNTTLFKHLDENSTEISEIMEQDLYVDNIMSSRFIDYYYYKLCMKEPEWITYKDKWPEWKKVFGYLRYDKLLKSNQGN